MTFSITKPATCLLWSSFTLTAVLALCLQPLRAQQPAATNTDLLRGLGNFEKSYSATPPWAGVDSAEYLRGFQETAPIVMSDGTVDQMSFPTSVAVADLNGDKLQDLIVADPSGIVWFYPNSGTATEPKFTYGEIIPIWLRGFLTTDGEGQRSIACNKIIATDYNEDGKVDLIFGTFLGEIFFVPNTGSSTAPRFVIPDNPRDAIINTRGDGKLWGNFFAPIYVDFTKSGRRDLILGEGTYSANNIYYYPNAGTSASPRFSEKTRQVLIQGMGREHLTPQMVDWNNDGIPDIMTGERDGTISVFICKSNDPKKFVFEKDPIIVKLGSSAKQGSLANPVPVDFNGDGLFDIVIGRSNGRVAVALNKGKLGAPQFDAPVEPKGTQPYPKYLSPTGWTLDAPPQSTFHIFRLVSGLDPANLTGSERDRALLSNEPGFSPPPESTGKFAGKLEFIPEKAKLFTQKLAMPSDAVFNIKYDGNFQFKPETNYEVTLWVKGSSWTKSSLAVTGGETYIVTDSRTGEKKYKGVNYGKTDDISISGSWSKVSKVIRYTKDKDCPAADKTKPISFGLTVKLVGKGTTFYIDDVTVVEKK